MFGRAPVIIIAAIAAVAQGVWIFVTGDANASVDWLIPVLTVLAGFAGERKTVSKETVKDAGLSPAAVERDAKNPSIPRREGE